MATLKQVAAIFSVKTVGEIASTALTYTQSSDFNWSAGIAELMDAGGDTVGCAIHDKRKEITLTCVMSSNLGTQTYLDALNDLNAVLIGPGTVCTVTCPFGGGSVSAIAGSYMVVAQRLREANNQYAMFEVDLIKHANISSYADIT